MANLRELLAQVESGVLHEACKRKNKKSKKPLKESTALTIEALETIIEMVKTNSLTLREQDELMESIETVFNNVADDYEETSSHYTCSECGWEGSEPNTDDEGENICPDCDSYVDEVYEDYEDDEDYEDYEDDEDYEDYDDEDYEDYDDEDYDDEDDEDYDDDDDEDEDEDMYEGAMLNKTPPAVKKAAKAYAKSASGKKAKKISAKKRAKFASKINACSEKGKTFSFKAMTCIKSKKQR